MHQNTITMKNDWTHNGQRFTSADIGSYYGFVYRITNLTNGMDYIGRKYFKTVRKLNPLKGFTTSPLYLAISLPHESNK